MRITSIIFSLSLIVTAQIAKGKAMTVYPSKQVSISIQRSPQEVYEYAANPEHLPKWAEGLSQSTLKKSGNTWIAESPMGQVKVKFADKNSLGVLDHDVTLPNGEVNHNPLRVVKNGQGSEVIFTLYRMPKVSEADFEKDAKAVEKDLQKLKSILENLNR